MEIFHPENTQVWKQERWQSVSTSVRVDHAISVSLLSPFAADDIQSPLDQMCPLEQGHLLAAIESKMQNWTWEHGL